MYRLCASLVCMILCVGLTGAQKGKAEPDYYPLGYSGDTWSGEVSSFDNKERTLTLKVGGKKAETFVVHIPDAPYEWTHDIRRNRVLDFPYDKKAKTQVFKYKGSGEYAADILPEGTGQSQQIQRRPNPPDSDRIEDFSSFLDRQVIVYYSNWKRPDGTPYSEAWRIYVLPKKK